MLQPNLAARLGPIQIPDCSADWRFLLPIADDSSVLIVTHGCDEFSRSLDAINVKTSSVRFDDFVRGINAQASFDVVAFPSGIPQSFSEVDHEKFHALLVDVLHMLRREGVLLFGFANHWSLGGRTYGKPMPAAERQISSALVNAGYHRVEIYAAFPNLETPEFIFSPAPADLQFVLRRRYRHKLPSLFLNLMCSGVSTKLLLKALPFYFAIAYRSEASAG